MLLCKWTDCAVGLRSAAMAALFTVLVAPAAIAVQIGGLTESNVIGGSGSYSGTYNAGTFASINILDQQMGTVSSGSADNTYWLNPDNGPANAYIVVDLGAAYRLSSLQMFNAHNGPFNDRGTGNFNIVAGNAITSAGAGHGFDRGHNDDSVGNHGRSIELADRRPVVSCFRHQLVPLSAI